MTASESASPASQRLALGLTVLWVALLSGCASWQQPAPVDEALFRIDAVSSVISDARLRGDVLVSARVLSREESERLLGGDVYDHGVEPVWIEIDNRSEQQVILLHSGADPDYFSPLEVSWLLHGSIFGSKNQAVDRHVQSVAFPRGVTEPGVSNSGVIFTNPSPGAKMINIDLLGDGLFLSTTLFPPGVEQMAAKRELPDVDVSGPTLRDFSDHASLREALEAFYRSAVSEEGLAMPPTTVLVGSVDDIAAALARRGYRQRARGRDQQLMFDAPPNFSIRKWGQAGTPGNWVNAWRLPITYRGQPVLLAQTGAPRGGRFSKLLGSSAPDPAMDYIRNLLVEDLLFSDSLAGLAAFQPGYAAERFAATTDGRVLVLFVTARRMGPDDAWVVDWDCVGPDCQQPGARPVAE